MTTSISFPTTEAKNLGFREEAAGILQRLRVTAARLFNSMPGGVRKSRDMQKLFGIDAKLSWQVFKLAGPGDALSLVPYVPVATSMRRLLAAALEHGANAEHVDEVRDAFAAFEQFVETHAGDRTSFDSMTRGLSDDDEAQQNDLQHRKAIFKGHSHYWGMQLETHAVTYMVSPGVQKGMTTLAHMRARFGLRRLRPDASPMIDRVRLTSRLGSDHRAGEPLDPAGAELAGSPIIAAYCSQPLPELRTTRDEDGTIYTELAGDAVGRRGEVDIVLGNVWREVPLGLSGDGKTFWFSSNAPCTIPTARLISTVVVHREAFPKWNHRFIVREEPSASQSHLTAKEVRLPFSERVVGPIAGSSGAWLREVPRYLEMLESVCDQLKWNLADFDIYRVQIEYPLLHTSAEMTFEIPTNELRGTSD